MGSLGGLEIAGIIIVLVLLFGAKKLPELGGSVGKSITNFKKGLRESQDDETGDEVAASKTHDTP